MRKVSKPKESRGRVRFLSDEERNRLLESCKISVNPCLYTVVVLALSTGARRGELLSLHWEDVDLKRGMLTFRETKNGERRSVPLTGYALEVLTKHAKIRRLNTTLVFPNSTCTQPMCIRRAWGNAVERAGIAIDDQVCFWKSMQLVRVPNRFLPSSVHTAPTLYQDAWQKRPALCRRSP
jgi:integrase